jgi:hypothetical protein
VYLDGAFIDLPIRVEIAMKMSAGQPPVINFHAPYLDNPMSLLRIEPGGFRIKYYLSHVVNPVAPAVKPEYFTSAPAAAAPRRALRGFRPVRMLVVLIK